MSKRYYITNFPTHIQPSQPEAEWN